MTVVLDYLRRPGNGWRDGSIVLLLAAVLTAALWLLAPRHLFFFDSVNFALALEHYNPALHQPQPPGYPLFVGLTRLLHATSLGPEDAFLTAGILGAAGAAYMLWRMAGAMAAVLFLFHPVLLFGGLTNQVRVFLAFIGCGTAWLASRAWAPDAPGWRILALGAFLGVASGFRPSTALLMLPLFAAVLWRQRRRAGLVTGAVALYAGGISCWLAPTLWATGGLTRYVELLRGYAGAEFTTSILYDAPASEAMRMAAAAIIWPGMGVLTWFWALGLASWRGVEARLRALGPILGLWFLPGFLFYALVHVADPDQSLLVAPVYCIVGAMALEAMLAERGWMRWRPRLLILLAAANFCLFLRPPPGIARSSGYGVVRHMDRLSNDVFGALDILKRRGPVQVLVYEPELTWRKIAYYARDARVYVIEEGGARVWDAHSTERAPAPASDGHHLLEPGGVIGVVLPKTLAQLRQELTEGAPRFQPMGPVLWREARSGERFEVASAPFLVKP